jgi:hypothetical protein
MPSCTDVGVILTKSKMLPISLHQVFPTVTGNLKIYLEKLYFANVTNNSLYLK